MSYKIQVNVPFTFENGQVLIQLQGHLVNLMKLDKVEEYHTVFRTIASDAVSMMVGQSQPQPPTQQPTTESDFSATAEKLRQTFQDMSDKAEQKLAQYANLTNANPTGPAKS